MPSSSSSIRSDRLTVPDAGHEVKLRAALAVAKRGVHSWDVEGTRELLQMLGLADYLPTVMHRDAAGHLRYRKGQTPDAAR